MFTCVTVRPETLFKKRLWHRCLPVNFAKLLKTSFFFFRTHPAAASDFGQVQEQQQQQTVDAKTYLKINKYIEKRKKFLDFSDFVQ